MRRNILYFFPVVMTLSVILRLFPARAEVQLGASATGSNAVKILRPDSSFDTLVPHDVMPENVADGFFWVEEPVWNRTGSYLLFSDISNNAIFTW